jgi:hypothetical protein
MAENPYKAPKVNLPRQNTGRPSVWLRVKTGVCFLFAFLFGILGLIWTASGWHWLQFEATGKTGDKLPIYGFGLSCGQVLLLGAVSGLGLALVWVYIGLRIIRPSATRDQPTTET